MVFKEFDFYMEKPIFLEFTDIPVGEELSKTIVLLGCNKTQVQLNYCGNEPDFRVEPPSFVINKQQKTKLVLIWTRGSEEKLNVALRFVSKNNEQFFIICQSQAVISQGPAAVAAAAAPPAGPGTAEEELQLLETIAHRLNRIRNILISCNKKRKAKLQAVQKRLVKSELKLNLAYMGNIANTLLTNFEQLYGNDHTKMVRKPIYSDYLIKGKINKADTVKIEEFKYFMELLYQIRNAVGHELLTIEDAPKIILGTVDWLSNPNIDTIYEEFIVRYRQYIKTPETPTKESIMKYSIYLVMGLEELTRITFDKNLNEWNKKAQEKLENPDSASQVPSNINADIKARGKRKK